VSETCEITYSNYPTIRIDDNPKVFTSVFKDSSGNVISGITPVWSTDISVANQTKILFVDNGDGTCSLSTIDDMKLIGTTIRLSLSDDSGIYSTWLDIKVKGWV